MNPVNSPYLNSGCGTVVAEVRTGAGARLLGGAKDLMQREGLLARLCIYSLGPTSLQVWAVNARRCNVYLGPNMEDSRAANLTCLRNHPVA